MARHIVIEQHPAPLLALAEIVFEPAARCDVNPRSEHFRRGASLGDAHLLAQESIGPVLDPESVLEEFVPGAPQPGPGGGHGREIVGMNAVQPEPWVRPELVRRVAELLFDRPRDVREPVRRFDLAGVDDRRRCRHNEAEPFLTGERLQWGRTVELPGRICRLRSGSDAIFAVLCRHLAEFRGAGSLGVAGRSWYANTANRSAAREKGYAASSSGRYWTKVPFRAGTHGRYYSTPRKSRWPPSSWSSSSMMIRACAGAWRGCCARPASPCRRTRPPRSFSRVHRPRREPVSWSTSILAG